MTFALDTGFSRPEIDTAAGEIDDTQIVRFRTVAKAQAFTRKIARNIESHEAPDDLDAYWQREAIVVDALHLFDPALSEELVDAYQSHRACLAEGLAAEAARSVKTDARPAQPVTPSPVTGNTTRTKNMNAFANFDTGGSGSEGPWIGWSARGAQDGSVPPKSFFLRDKDGRQAFDGFAKGVILDIETMQTGWCYSSGIVGQAPDWKWNASVAKFEPRPGDDYKKGLQVRCAIGGGNIATWEDSGAGAWNGFTGLVPALQQGPVGKLPLVRMTGVRDEKYARGSTAIPVLEVIKWVDRPDCLKEGAAAGIDTGADDEPTTLSQRATPKAASPAPADNDLEF